MKHVKAIAAVSALGICAATAATSQEMTLKLAHTYPANHYLVEHGINVMIKDIEEKTNGQIKFEVYPAAQLGRDNVGNLNSGLTDVAYLAQSVESTNLALSTGPELPGVYGTACEGADLVSSMMKEGGILDTEELAPKGIHFLYVSTFPPYTIFSGPNNTIDSVDDLNGIKIRAGGAAITKSFRLLGAVPVQIPGGELYDSLKRGVVDSAFWPPVAIPAYDLEDVMTSALARTSIGGTAPFVGIRTEVWNGLSDQNKQIFTDAGALAQKTFCEWIDGETQQVMDGMVKDHGLKVTTLSDEEFAALQEKLSSVREDWAAEMQSAGKNGQAVLDAMNAFQAGQK